MRRREGVMREHRLSRLGIRLEQRKVHDPGEGVRRRGLGAEPADHLAAHTVEHRRGQPVRPDSEQRHVAVSDAQRPKRGGGEMLADRARDLLALAFDPRQSGAAQLLGGLRELVHVLAGQRGAAFHREAPHPRPVLQGRVEERHAERADLRGPVGDRELVAQVRLVGAIALHRLAPRDAGERPRHPLARLVPQRHQHGLDEAEHVLYSDERCLEVDLGELGLAVVAQILVAEAARDLEVAVEPRDHEQLLVDLRGLGQRVELPGMYARWHHVVARSLRGRLGEDRRFDLQELELGEGAPGPLQQPVAQHEVRLHLGASQVEVTVLEPQLFSGELLTLGTGHRNRRRHGGSDDRELRRVDLDLAGRQLWVPHVPRARNDLALQFDHRLAGQPGCGPADVFRCARADRDLDDPGAVAQIDEHDPTEVAAPVHPSAQPHPLPHVLRPQLAAAVRAPGRPTQVVYVASASHTAR